MVFNMLQNYNHRYHIHYIIIKYVDFDHNLYVINLNVTLSFKVFKKFYCMLYELLV